MDELIFKEKEVRLLSDWGCEEYHSRESRISHTKAYITELENKLEEAKEWLAKYEAEANYKVQRCLKCGKTFNREKQASRFQCPHCLTVFDVTPVF